MTRTLVLPEVTTDKRVQAAATIIEKGGIATVLDINKLQPSQIAQCRDELTSLQRYSAATNEEIDKLMSDELVLAGLCLRAGLADGMIAGAAHPTADVLRVALRVVRMKQGATVASSCFIMKTPHNGDLIFADCAVNPNPDAVALIRL